jgi:hypothetical protein
MTAVLLAALATMLGACSTTIEGRSQQIPVNTTPSATDCGLYRRELRTATVQNALGIVLIEKIKHDMWIVCVKPGHQQASYLNHSGVAGITVGNVILGGGVGWIIDNATGSDNKYDSPLNITLVSLPPGQAEGPVSPPTSWSQAPSPVAQPTPTPASVVDEAPRTN